MSRYDIIYTVVCSIPTGRVCTYGRIAAASAAPRGARGVGSALSALGPEQSLAIPWWRVVNAAGQISNLAHADAQRALLESEGVRVNAQGRIDLAQFLWEP